MEPPLPPDEAMAAAGNLDPDLPAARPRGAGALGNLLAVLLGGAVGTAARSAVSVHLPSPGALPWQLWCINASGGLLLGLMATLLEARGAPDPVRLFTTAGLLGGWTTYSAIAATALQAGHGGQLPLGIGYALGGLALAFLAAWFGRRAGLAWTGRP